MQISEAAGGIPQPGLEPCRFPKLEECAHFHYERVQLPIPFQMTLQTNMDQSLHSQHAIEDEDMEWFMVQVTSGDECWLVQRNFENFQMLDEQLHQCIFDRKISQLTDLANVSSNEEALEQILAYYLERFSRIADNSVNCGPVLNWFQMDNKGHRLLVPSEESRSINTPAVAAAYSVRRYVSQARDELNLEVGDMISVIDMASPGESMWWRGKRGFQVGFFPQHCVHIIGDKVPRNMPLPPPIVGSLALSPVKPVLRRHGKLITFFRSFILNRPSRRRLKQSGILKERVFGCDLGEHLLNSGRDVPTVLRSCAEFIENKGIVDGIYRLSGITSNIQKLRNAFDEDRIPDLYTEDILKDIHSVASLLKMYFRELPNPLCTYQLYQSFVNAVQGCNTTLRSTETDHDRLLKMREAVQKLPPPHYRTLDYLMRHLAKVANHSGSTGMTTRNLAIVWAPNLLRCEALEIGGVAALQGVGVQAVVTEFLIYYADFIFSDRLPEGMDETDYKDGRHPDKRCSRPNSLNVSNLAATKLITLEEARNKRLTNKLEDGGSYIEVGGGPRNLPEKYHTVIDLPLGARKRGHTKRSPLGWRMFFTRSSSSRNSATSSQPIDTKTRKTISSPIAHMNDKSIAEPDLNDMRRKLRSVKSAESLISGHSEPIAISEDVLGPLNSLNKPPGHNRSVSHDSYFDMLQSSQNNSEGSLLDLSEIHLNFDLEESEMRIFSEDESLVSSPRIQKEDPTSFGQKRVVLTRSRPHQYVGDDFGIGSCQTDCVSPSPKKQARVVLSPDAIQSQSRKRTRLEDQLSDIQYIDCSTPENVVVVCTEAVVHAMPNDLNGFTAPKNKSPRNSDNLDTNIRQSLILSIPNNVNSFTDMDHSTQGIYENFNNSSVTPTTAGYNRLEDSSTSEEGSPLEIGYNEDELKSDDDSKIDLRKRRESPRKLKSELDSPTYENILTTISITYKSPPRSSATSPSKIIEYENVILNPEKVVIPTSTASLPVQEASQPPDLFMNFLDKSISTTKPMNEERPRSLGALESHNQNSKTESSTLRATSSGAICASSSDRTSLAFSILNDNEEEEKTSSSCSWSNIQYTASLSSAPYNCMENSKLSSATLSEVIAENLTASRTTMNTDPPSSLRNTPSPNVSPTTTTNNEENSDIWPSENFLLQCDNRQSQVQQSDKRKSEETETSDDNVIYQQVKYFRRSISEVNALLDLETNETNVKQADVVQSVNREVQMDEESPKINILEKSVTNDIETDKPESPSNNVKDLMSIFEEKCTEIDPKSFKNGKNANTSDLNSANSSVRLRKFYERDGLPPCLRARNLKFQQKTRSLDEHEFEKECGDLTTVTISNPRRKSYDENIGFKTNSLPKMLNQPKSLPRDENGQMESLHLFHSTEKINNECDEEREQKKRERIEKYKEERRRILSEKYRSESFKEDKDILIGRLKLYKGKDDPMDELVDEGSKLLMDVEKVNKVSRRKSTKSESDQSSSEDRSINMNSSSHRKIKNLSATNTTGSLSSLHSIDRTERKPPKSGMGNSLKTRTAIFEQQNPTIISSAPNKAINPSTIKSPKKIENVAMRMKNSSSSNTGFNTTTSDEDSTTSLSGLPTNFKDLTRQASNRKEDKEVELREGEHQHYHRRHTYESREKEMELEKLKRISLDSRNSPRREKMSPTYCIKDMKAIFESKSKQ